MASTSRGSSVAARTETMATAPSTMPQVQANPVVFSAARTIGMEKFSLRTSDTTQTQTSTKPKPKSMVLPDPPRLAGSTAPDEVLHFGQANDLLKSPGPRSGASGSGSGFQRTQSLPLLSLGGSLVARASSTPATTTTQTPASTDDPKIVEKSYGGTPVYEMNCNGIAVMKRRSDAWLNANQILKVAGLNTLQSREVMESEVWGGEHETLKRGGGAFQGTWIPLARAVALCEKYNCEVLLRPLLHFEKQDERVLEKTSEQRVDTTEPTLSLSTEQLQAQPPDHELFLSSPTSNPPPEPTYDIPLDRLFTPSDEGPSRASSSGPPEPQYDIPLDRLFTPSDGNPSRASSPSLSDSLSMPSVYKKRKRELQEHGPVETDVDVDVDTQKPAKRQRRTRWIMECVVVPPAPYSIKTKTKAPAARRRTTAVVPKPKPKEPSSAPPQTQARPGTVRKPRVRTPQPSSVDMEVDQHDQHEQHGENASPGRGSGGLMDALNNAWAQNADALEDAAREVMEERRVKSKRHRHRHRTRSAGAASVVSASTAASASASASASGDQDGDDEERGRKRKRATEEEGSSGGHVPEEEQVVDAEALSMMDPAGEDDEGDNLVVALGAGDDEVARSPSIPIPTSSPTTSHTPPPPPNDLPDGDAELEPELERQDEDVVMVPLVPSAPSRSQSPQAPSLPSPRAVSPPAQEYSAALDPAATREEAVQDQAHPEPVQTIPGHVNTGEVVAQAPAEVPSPPARVSPEPGVIQDAENVPEPATKDTAHVPVPAATTEPPSSISVPTQDLAQLQPPPDLPSAPLVPEPTPAPAPPTVTYSTISLPPPSSYAKIARRHCRAWLIDRGVRLTVNEAIVDGVLAAGNEARERRALLPVRHVIKEEDLEGQEEGEVLSLGEPEECILVRERLEVEEEEEVVLPPTPKPKTKPKPKAKPRLRPGPKSMQTQQAPSAAKRVVWLKPLVPKVDDVEQRSPQKLSMSEKARGKQRAVDVVGLGFGSSSSNAEANSASMFKTFFGSTASALPAQAPLRPSPPLRRLLPPLGMSRTRPSLLNGGFGEMDLSQYDYLEDSASDDDEHEREGEGDLRDWARYGYGKDGEGTVNPAVLFGGGGVSDPELVQTEEDDDDDDRDGYGDDYGDDGYGDGLAGLLGYGQTTDSDDESYTEAKPKQRAVAVGAHKPKRDSSGASASATEDAYTDASRSSHESNVEQPRPRLIIKLPPRPPSVENKPDLSATQSLSVAAASTSTANGYNEDKFFRYSAPWPTGEAQLFCHHCRRRSDRLFLNYEDCGHAFCVRCIMAKFPPNTVAFVASPAAEDCPRCAGICPCDYCCKQRGVAYRPLDNARHRHPQQSRQSPAKSKTKPKSRATATRRFGPASLTRTNSRPHVQMMPDPTLDQLVVRPIVPYAIIYDLNDNPIGRTYFDVDDEDVIGEGDEDLDKLYEEEPAVPAEPEVEPEPLVVVQDHARVDGDATTDQQQAPAPPPARPPPNPLAGKRRRILQNVVFVKRFKMRRVFVGKVQECWGLGEDPVVYVDPPPAPRKGGSGKKGKRWFVGDERVLAMFPRPPEVMGDEGERGMEVDAEGPAPEVEVEAEAEETPTPTSSPLSSPPLSEAGLPDPGLDIGMDADAAKVDATAEPVEPVALLAIANAESETEVDEGLDAELIATELISEHEHDQDSARDKGADGPASSENEQNLAQGSASLVDPGSEESSIPTQSAAALVAPATGKDRGVVPALEAQQHESRMEVEEEEEVSARAQVDNMVVE
ncbi:hypothetical protein HMN09_00844100 [Mycena chlorophos]|uniref:HTH APSES-type domain-containing protein n=1 Tax=Mycena chlorophos TaxID=658473 RepID=A0A8H6SV00_MYCCL|nr:hypothetical protein HMN09_00844100 [Mycena chlorophos]